MWKLKAGGLGSKIFSSSHPAWAPWGSSGRERRGWDRAGGLLVFVCVFFFFKKKVPLRQVSVVSNWQTVAEYPASQGIVIPGDGAVHASSISVCLHWSPGADLLILWITHCISVINVPPILLNWV